MALLGIDSVTGIWKKFNNGNNKENNTVDEK